MSSCPGLTLEDYLAWLYDVVVEGQEDANFSLGMAELLGTAVKRRPRLNEKQFAIIVAMFEEHREEIEDKLLNFDEEDNGSWRDYAGAAFDYYTSDEKDKKIFEIIRLFHEGNSLPSEEKEKVYALVENYLAKVQNEENSPVTVTLFIENKDQTVEFITQETIAPFRAMAVREISEKMRITKNLSDAIAALAVHGKYDSESQEEFAMSSVSSLLRESLALASPQTIDFLTGNGPIAKQLKQSLAMAKLFARPEDAERIQQFEQELDVKFNYRPMIGTALQNIEWKSILGVIIDLQNKYLLEDVPDELFTEVQASEPIEKSGLYVSESLGKSIYMILDVNEIPITIIITKDADPVIRVVHKWENQELFIFNICYFPGMYKAVLEQLEAFPKLH